VAGVGEEGDGVRHQPADYFDNEEQRGEQERNPKTPDGRISDV
jgi:hypothetical protein